MNILIPGRHHLLTDYQFKYYFKLLQQGLFNTLDVDGNPTGIDQPIHNLIFAVTSANHSNTRRNPVPFFLRALPILDFCQELNVQGFIYGIDDVGHLDDFAGYVLKKIRHDSDGFHDLTPENTLVACSTPVMDMYAAKGFRILPVELVDKGTWQTAGPNPWELVEEIAATPGNWRQSARVLDQLYASSFHIWSQYRLGEKVKMLFSDAMIGEDGDLTESRDYSAYVRQMDEIAELKYRETASHIRPGRVGDIGCAVGTWIKLASKDARLRESDFFGIEVARQLYQICMQRKENGEFSNPCVFFAQKNAVTDLCFDRNSMNTIHTSSLTHEIESYGGRADLLAFIRNRFEELAPGGVWINRDVVGPSQPDQMIWMKLNATDGRNDDWELPPANAKELASYLKGLSTRALFLRFAVDFRQEEGYQMAYRWVESQGQEYAALRLADAMEFISRKDYPDNWRSEMHETFTFWSFEDWKLELAKAGYFIEEASHAYTNNWLVENRYRGKADLFSPENGVAIPLEYPETHMLMVAGKRV